MVISNCSNGSEKRELTSVIDAGQRSNWLIPGEEPHHGLGHSQRLRIAHDEKRVRYGMVISNCSNGYEKRELTSKPEAGRDLSHIDQMADHVLQLWVRVHK
jgi:hypothetical protein